MAGWQSLVNHCARKALEYCQKSYEIDLNRNGKIPGEAGTLNAYGVCEDHVYCFNIIECNWGPSEKSRLSPKKCKDIMCDVYNDRFNDNAISNDFIIEKMPFGSCDENDPEITVNTHSLAVWHTDNYAAPTCPAP